MGIIFGRTGAASPNAKMLFAGNGFEIRRYPTYFIAQVDGADSGAQFRTLANYIGVFGEPLNQKREALEMTAPVVKNSQKLAMTTPVVSADESKESGIRTVQFILPSHLTTLEDVPVPTDPSVTIAQIPERVLAVRAFSGYSTKQNVQDNLNWLLMTLHTEGWITSKELVENEWQLAEYHPPFTLPYFRLNEIWVRIDPTHEKLSSLAN